MSDETTLLDEFRAEVEAFLVETRMAQRELGLASCNDGSFVADLRVGREPRISTIGKVRTFMREYRCRKTSDEAAIDVPPAEVDPPRAA